MITLRYQARLLRFDIQVPTTEGGALAKSLGNLYVQTAKQALKNVGAYARGSTSRSIRQQMVLESPSRNEWRRRVVAGIGFEIMDKGRRKGAPMPVRLVRTTAKGKKIFQPFPEMERWLKFKGIPKERWFLVMRAIKRKGIAPRNVRNVMFQLSVGKQNERARRATNRIAKNAVIQVRRTMF